MGFCKNECTCLAVIVGILAGVLLGVLYALGFVETGIIFWAFLAIGVAAIFLAPIYASQSAVGGDLSCFCKHKKLLLTAAVGTIIIAALGLILAPVVSVTVLSIVLGIATAFPVTLLVVLLCLAVCLAE